MTKAEQHLMSVCFKNQPLGQVMLLTGSVTARRFSLGSAASCGEQGGASYFYGSVGLLQIHQSVCCGWLSPSLLCHCDGWQTVGVSHLSQHQSPHNPEQNPASNDNNNGLIYGLKIV